MAAAKKKIHEVDFCAQVASWVNESIRQNPAAYPFREALVEGFGSGAAAQKRKDLRFVGDGGRTALCGEVKLPGTPEGRSALDYKLVSDAAAKADDAGVQYFFTWNVNDFVLWDRSLWQRPWFERRVRIWHLERTLASPQDVARDENLQFIKDRFLPRLLTDLADILSGRRSDWSMPPDEFFIRSLESHLDWPVLLTQAYILESTDKDKAFDAAVQAWMRQQDWTLVRKPHEEWARLVDNMAKTLAYVWTNRLIFYKALHARFPDLPDLTLAPSVRKPAAAVAAFNSLFRQAAERSGDYEPLLMPDATDWATELVFHAPHALDAWRGLLQGIEHVDFHNVPSDVAGRIFQKLIGPDERHRYGQHFTGDDAVDLINAFCIRSGEDAVLDPACGSGSFLVRAYYRKRHLDADRTHLGLIGDLFGCDIALYPAHLATLNLAAREINEEANYPRIARRNFFDFAPGLPFCELPAPNGGRRPIPLPPLDAVVGNPPYVRHEGLDAKYKARLGTLCADAWRDLRMARRSDLHCYFWPLAAQLLRADGYFGFLTSSSWLDVEYGFALQAWILGHFRLLAVMESAAEPWFEDARVKTCAAILQRCDDEAERMATRVRFVRFSAKLADIIGVPPGKDESARQAAVETLRDRILSADSDCEDRDMRIIVKTQGTLWSDGVRAGRILDGAPEVEGPGEDEDDESEEGDEAEESFASGAFASERNAYRAGKWGRYVRAPDVYFDVMRRFGGRFIPLGEIATVRYGVKTGCDAFFAPVDVTEPMLARWANDKEFREATGAPRKRVAAGALRIVQVKDGTIHPVEAEYLAREVHSLKGWSRLAIHAGDVNRVLLMIGEEMDQKLKDESPWVWHYLQYGAQATFPSKKSKPVPVPQRSFISKRAVWYNLTDQVKPGAAFWPKGQQYRHMVVSNPDGLIGNCRLYDVTPKSPDVNPAVLVAVLNSTLVALWRNFYGRYTGMEGAMETMVVDALMTEIPNPTLAPPATARRLTKAFDALSGRDTGDMAEEQLMECHTPERARKLAAGPPAYSQELRQTDRRELDDAVLELLGMSGSRERKELIDRLYEATARHFREVRVVEIEKMQQRAKSGGTRFSIQDLAADIWDAAGSGDFTPLGQWVGEQSDSGTAITIPQDRPAVLIANPLFGGAAVAFGKGRRVRLDFSSEEQAALVSRLAGLGVTGQVNVPSSHTDCARLLTMLNLRLDASRTRFRELCASRTGDANTREHLLDVLMRWFAVGRERRHAAEPGSA